jgi:hydroxyacylglutathione hydrolase
MFSNKQVAIQAFNDPMYMENTLVVHRPGRPGCWIVDPGLPPSAAELIEFVERQSLQPVAVVLTHTHVDHIAGVPEVLQRWPDLPLYVGEPERAALSDPAVNMSIMIGEPIRVSAGDVRDLRSGDELELEGLRWQVLDTAGHSAGGRSLYCRQGSVVIVGDALFAGGIGRVDLPGGDERRLLSNIRGRLLSLPDETAVVSGHGPVTTIGRERRNNPFLTGLA